MGVAKAESGYRRSDNPPIIEDQLSIQAIPYGAHRRIFGMDMTCPLLPVEGVDMACPLKLHLITA